MKKLLSLVLCFSTALLLFSSCKEEVVINPLIPVSQKAVSDTASAFYGNFDSFPSERNSLPIGVFDSGLGGLTVLEVLLSLDEFDNITGKQVSDGISDFAGENFEYLGDEANMPYGDYAAEGKNDYLRELVVKDALFLLEDKYYNLAIDDYPTGIKERVKIIVVACNTATAYGLSDVKNLLEASGTGVKVIGVINAGVRASLSELDPSKSYAVGVMATPGTIASGAYERTIKELAAAKGFTGTIQVFSQGGLGFANAVEGRSDYVLSTATVPREEYRGPVLGKEEGNINPSIIDRYHFDFSDNHILYTKERGEYTRIQLNSAANYARFHLVSLLEKHRTSGCKFPLNNIILGCTHYPFLLDTLNKVVAELRNYKKDGIFIYRNSISKDFKFIDPAKNTAIECYTMLRESGELSFSPTEGNVSAFLSVPAFGLGPDCIGEDGSFLYGFKFGREAGTEDITFKQVPFSSRYIDEQTQQRMNLLVPTSFSFIKERL